MRKKEKAYPSSEDKGEFQPGEDGEVDDPEEESFRFGEMRRAVVKALYTKGSKRSALFCRTPPWWVPVARREADRTYLDPTDAWEETEELRLEHGRDVNVLYDRVSAKEDAARRPDEPVYVKETCVKYMMHEVSMWNQRRVIRQWWERWISFFFQFFRARDERYVIRRSSTDISHELRPAVSFLL
jgi:hypothetical protein